MSPVAKKIPVCLYLRRQPLQPAVHHLPAHLCGPRAQADMSWELSRGIVDQVRIARVVRTAWASRCW